MSVDIRCEEVGYNETVIPLLPFRSHRYQFYKDKSLHCANDDFDVSDIEADGSFRVILKTPRLYFLNTMIYGELRTKHTKGTLMFVCANGESIVRYVLVNDGIVYRLACNDEYIR